MQFKKITTLFTCFIFSISFAPAINPLMMPNEGMWLLSLIGKLNIEEMQKMGCELTAEQIYSVTNPSLKDAIMEFGGFCTGEFVSSKGLVFTNHHCGYDAIASVSSTANNYLDNGFWAANYSEEKPIEGLYVEILDRMADISDSIVPVVKDMDALSRQMKVTEIQNRIIERESAATGLVVTISSMFYGNQYYIFYYKRFNDVRFVGAPPQSIGKFGGDTDNWMWPRHTGDFSVFRVYADKNNNPADFNTGNVPYKPKKYLKCDISGFTDGSFSMIMGYPGQTERYLTSYAMKEVIYESNPAQIDIFKAVTDVEKADMDKDEAVRLLLSSDYAQLMNALKLYGGQIEGMTKVMDAVEIKQKQEADFQTWVNAKGGTIKTKYGNLNDDFKNAYTDLSQVNKEFYYKIYPVVIVPTGNFSLELNSLEAVLSDDSATADMRTATIQQIQTAADEMFKSMIYDNEKKKVAALLGVMNDKLPDSKKPQAVKDILAQTKGATPQEKFMNWTDEAFESSVFTTPEKLKTFLDNPSLKKLKKDKLYAYYLNLYNDAMLIRPQFVAARQSINRLTKNYIAGMMEMQPDKAFYPDANFTPRITYGKIEEYSPRDAVQYQWATHLKGVIQKMDNTNSEFTVPDKLYQLYKNKDFGPYADKTGDVPVCFLSDNDITGGNSGSPVMNGKGNLIGLAFDSDYEGTPGDYVFDPNMNRTISVDIRYVLFLIDKYGNAQNIIKELEIVQ